MGYNFCNLQGVFNKAQHHLNVPSFFSNISLFWIWKKNQKNSFFVKFVHVIEFKILSAFILTLSVMTVYSIALKYNIFVK